MSECIRRTRCSWLPVAVVVLSGCSTGASQLGLFPSPNALTDAARLMRAVTPPPPALNRELDKAPAPPYVVEPGDVLLVQPSSLESPVRLLGDQPVLPDGTIQLGKYGRLWVIGKTLEEIERDANNLISAREKDAGAIVVRLVTRDSKVFYVLGEVNAPGAFPLRGRETVLDALVAAGGLNSNASRGGIILSRPTAPDSCRIVLPVHYHAIVQLGDTTTNYQIRAGDRVYVPGKGMLEDLLACFKPDANASCTPVVPCCEATPAPVVTLGTPRLEAKAQPPFRSIARPVQLGPPMQVAAEKKSTLPENEVLPPATVENKAEPVATELSQIKWDVRTPLPPLPGGPGK